MVLSDGQRLVLGGFVLILVDVIWVVSSELTEYVFKSEGYNKPLFSTYLKNALFSLYLLGFLLRSSWRDSCWTERDYYAPLEMNSDGELSVSSVESPVASGSPRHPLSESQFVPLPRDDEKSSGCESESEQSFLFTSYTHDQSDRLLPVTSPDDSQSDHAPLLTSSVAGQSNGSASVTSDELAHCQLFSQQQQQEQRRSVSFNRLLEVRRLPSREAAHARAARRSFSASQQLRLLQQRLQRPQHEAVVVMSPVKVALLALQFSLPFFGGQYCYQLALSGDAGAHAGYVNALSGCSSLFTLLLAAVAGSRPTDTLTATTSFITLANVTAAVCVSLSGVQASLQVPVSALWSLAGALCYSVYVVMLQARIDRLQQEQHADVNLCMFFGFVGVCVAGLYWPCLLAAHWSGVERLQLPSRRQLVFLLANGLLGTVVSELMWMWGCMLTSSLIATMSLSLTVPLTMLVDVLWRSLHYSPLFYGGATVAVLTSASATYIAYRQNWDPLGEAVWRLYSHACCCGRSQQSISQPSTNQQSCAAASHAPSDNETSFSPLVFESSDSFFSLDDEEDCLASSSHSLVDDDDEMQDDGLVIVDDLGRACDDNRA